VRIVWVGLLAVVACAAQSTLSFEAASVKPCKSNDQPTSNFPLGPGDAYTPNGGLFRATGQPLVLYISFAYKLNGNQLQLLQSQLPGWVMSDRYDIEARAKSDPGKDGMRMMMRALLADRFKFAFHDETRHIPVLAMTLIKPATLGPQLWPHAQDAPCSTETAPGPNVLHTPAGDLPKLCNGIYPMPAAQRGRLRFAGRNVTIGFIGDTLSAGTRLGRPMVDQTSIDGTVDFILEFSFDPNGGPPPSIDSEPSIDLQEALRSQLGIKLVSQKGPFKVMAFDHIEKPSAN
jgi:uncharacterized protein (TIGR03435 family)